MKLSASLLVFSFLFYGVLGENVIDNKVNTSGKIFTLKISSTQYNISNLELKLVHEQDEFIFGTEEKGSFVVNPPGNDVKAFGYLDGGRFFGQFTYDGRTYVVDPPPPPGHQGGTLSPWQVKGVATSGTIFKLSENIPNDDGLGGQVPIRAMTVGNICRMRIIIDKFLLKLFNNDKEQMRNNVKYFERYLNEIYNEANVSVKVHDKQLPLKFKVVDLQFHDEDFCRITNSSSSGNSSSIMIIKRGC